MSEEEIPVAVPVQKIDQGNAQDDMTCRRKHNGPYNACFSAEQVKEERRKQRKVDNNRKYDLENAVFNWTVGQFRFTSMICTVRIKGSVSFILALFILLHLKARVFSKFQIFSLKLFIK
jgi:hypothetical protein